MRWDMLQRSRRRIGEGPAKAAHGLSRLLPGHLLPTDGYHQRVEHQSGSTEPVTRVAAVQLPDHLVVGDEPAWIVFQAAESRQTFEQPGRPLPPRLTNEVLSGPAKADRARTIRGPSS